MSNGNKDERSEEYISVDIEAAGPIPGEYSMLSIGACPVHDLDEGFYVELRPISDRFVPKALEVSRFSLDRLCQEGINPTEAMSSFRAWIENVSADRRPVFVGFNASFDWAFVNWYFHAFLGENPFGIGGVDIKAYYMGLSGSQWDETKSSNLPERFQPSHPSTHNALDDARAQAEIFAEMLAESRKQRR